MSFYKLIRMAPLTLSTLLICRDVEDLKKPNNESHASDHMSELFLPSNENDFSETMKVL